MSTERYRFPCYYLDEDYYANGYEREIKYYINGTRVTKERYDNVGEVITKEKLDKYNKWKCGWCGFILFTKRKVSAEGRCPICDGPSECNDDMLMEWLDG